MKLGDLFALDGSGGRRGVGGSRSPNGGRGWAPSPTLKGVGVESPSQIMWDDVHVLHPNRIVGTTDSQRLIYLTHGSGGCKNEWNRSERERERESSNRHLSKINKMRPGSKVSFLCFVVVLWSSILLYFIPMSAKTKKVGFLFNLERKVDSPTCVFVM